nr:uncharacterized protein LOC127298326 [Lolium perenne]
MRNGEGYAQTVLPASDLADKARKDLAFVADVHGACQPVHTELGREVFATPTRTICPAMNGSVQTPVNPNTSIKPLPNHKGVEMNKIVDFGGIEKETSQNVRSSGRLRAQPNYDATQMERARMLLQKRDELPVIGYPARCSLDSTMGFPSPFGTAGGYGYWMQPDASGCSGLLFPGYWVATH